MKNVTSFLNTFPTRLDSSKLKDKFLKISISIKIKMLLQVELNS